MLRTFLKMKGKGLPCACHVGIQGRTSQPRNYVCKSGQFQTVAALSQGKSHLLPFEHEVGLGRGGWRKERSMSESFGEEKTRQEFVTISSFAQCSLCTDSSMPALVSNVTETKSHSVA